MSSKPLYTNSYSEPAPEDLSNCYGPDPYELNFMWPIDFSLLESERVKLVPFIPRLHAQIYVDHAASSPDMSRWLPFDLSKLEDVLSFVESFIRRSPACIAFAVMDKGSDGKDVEGKMAGVIALIKSDKNLVTELGWVVTFPEYQRTYVTGNAIGILLRFCLELPSKVKGALGLRRVQWTANPLNLKSIAAAKRMGMKEEGTHRWVFVLAEGKEGHATREGDPKQSRLGRGSTMLAMCCDDWENGGREFVQKMIDLRR